MMNKRASKLSLFGRVKYLLVLLMFISVTMTMRALLQTHSDTMAYVYNGVVKQLSRAQWDGLIKNSSGMPFYLSNVTRLKERMSASRKNVTFVEVKTPNGSVTLAPSKSQKVIGIPSQKQQRLHLTSGFRYPMHVNLREAYTIKMLNGTNIIRDTPINPHPFVYLHRPDPCTFSPNASRSLLILVKSSVGNSVIRGGVRRTWGNIKDLNIRLVFLLGVNTSDPGLQRSVDTEAEVYRDIVQENFMDTYHNNTYKTTMAFNWGVEHCPSAKVNYFVDDDYLVLLPNLLLYIRRLAPRHIENLFTGLLVPHSRPFSDPKSKWFVPLSEYQYDFWVPYLAGGAFLVSDSIMRKFVFAFPYVKYMRIDDSYLGIVAYKLGIKPQPNMLFNYNRGAINTKAHARWFSSHGFKNPVIMEKKWSALMMFLV
ncbi:beta-1,3-galactosyltransferase brn-like [Mizuhopecten yessoensis]|uniref:Hexosyltransferase n=1 Tax=Mizuhopecten yessoensis TaxID=6573 RepID=A0A210QML4_MIZYE|nr:beta-1,3-galactosyltransferase brn-like [Mizuhopecten yessoensis]XP_021354560.1 beta-1,3-galactosyltransferase brn-like [Mizuhopecten yessoensis]XP_021354561.1 beta-1,3-galactosyltransferase brn-like [Mizuhopecten yessoensis]XP_021354562.1 beta-1,3-galactosyltransferase brn-like [Mizuhopecten yessoensis]OWF49976.1 Beta-1,3-galactosyltransferase brn [Mizuhopecten yessoensis]